MENDRKFKKAKVVIPGETKERYILVQKYQPKDADDVSYGACESCPYGTRVCTILKDPQHPDDKYATFQDYCGNLGNKEADPANQELVGGYYPVEGTIEDNLGDTEDVYQSLISKNPYVKISDLIDRVCDGECSFYRKDHSLCKKTNDLCLLQNVLKNNTSTKDGR